jgi:hypothetical protein
MSYETVEIIRSLPVINGFVQIYSAKNKDKTRHKVSQALSLVSGSSQINMDRQVLFALPAANAYSGYTTNPTEPLE